MHAQDVQVGLTTFGIVPVHLNHHHLSSKAMNQVVVSRDRYYTKRNGIFVLNGLSPSKTFNARFAAGITFGPRISTPSLESASVIFHYMQGKRTMSKTNARGGACRFEATVAVLARLMRRNRKEVQTVHTHFGNFDAR